MKPSALARWADLAPAGAIGLVAPAVLTHRKMPASAKPWPNDATTGDFRDSELARAAIAPLAEAVKQLRAGSVVFRSPESFSASAANRELLARFFGEIATAETFKRSSGAEGEDRRTVAVQRVWLPGGLWEVRTALKLANELGITLGFDPMVRAPEEPPEVHYDLEAESLYFRIENPGRAGTIRNEKLEDLAMLVQHYEDLPLTVAFASPERWADARNLKKLFDAEAAATREED